MKTATLQDRARLLAANLRKVYYQHDAFVMISSTARDIVTQTTPGKLSIPEIAVEFNCSRRPVEYLGMIPSRVKKRLYETQK